MTNDEIAELVEQYGYDDEGVILFNNFDYHTAFIGFSHDGRAVYDYNTLNAIGYDPRHPIILFPIEEF